MFYKLLISFSLVFLSALHLGVATASPVTSFTLRYDVKLSGFKVGKLTTKFRVDSDGNAVYEKVAKMGNFSQLFTADLQSERSESLWANGEYQALRFDYLEKDGKEEEKHKILFDWKEDKAHVWWRRHFAVLDVPEGATDRATLDLRVWIDARAQPQQLEYVVVDRGKLKPRVFEFAGTETLKTPVGTFDTIKYRLENPEGKGKVFVLWLAKSLEYLPARIDHLDSKNGVNLRMELREREITE